MKPHVARDRRTRAHPSPWRTGLSLGTLGFVIAVVIGLPSETLVAKLPPYSSIPLVLFVIALAVLFDMVGVAATAADPVPLHARSSKRGSGARQALWLIARADRVASITMDIIGDVTAAVAGAASVAIMYALAEPLGLPSNVLNALGIGIVTFLFIGVKGLEKGYSIRNANRIIHFAGVVLERVERITRIEFTKGPRNGRRRRG